MTEFSITTEALYALVEECRRAADTGTDDEAHELFNAALFAEVAAGRIETYERMRERARLAEWRIRNAALDHPVPEGATLPVYP